ncbi:MAG: hypothetical protein ABI945_06455 [Nitrospirales bacterium]
MPTTAADPLARRGFSRSVSSADRHGSPYQEPAGSPTRRRAQTWRSLFIAPCALREAHGKGRVLARLGGRVQWELQSQPLRDGIHE